MTRFFDDTTVETAMMSSIDYNYTTINNFDENIDDSLATLDNIVIMTINTRTVSLKLDDIILTSAHTLHIASASLGYPQVKPNVLPDRRSSDGNVSWYVCGNVWLVLVSIMLAGTLFCRAKN